MVKRSPEFIGLALGLALLSLNPTVNAASLIVDGLGQLTGATDVEVGGSLFDVVFTDGSCISDFSGCDEQSDFAFTNLADAHIAAAALLEQVFLDGIDGLFDSTPELTFGCSDQFWCISRIPYGFAAGGGVLSGSAFNDADPGEDELLGDGTGVGIPPSASLTNNLTVGDAVNEMNFAVFTPVPLPAPIILLGSAFVGLGWFRRKTS